MPLKTHPISEEQIMAYLDGELESGQAVEVAAHLELCRDCQQTRGELLVLARQLATFAVEETPERLEVPKEELSSSTAPKRVLSLNWRWISLAVGAAAIVIIAIGTVTTTKMVTPTMHFEAMAPLEQSQKPLYDRMATDRAQSFSAYMPRAAKREASAPASSSIQPLVVRTAQLALIVKNFNDVRSALEGILGTYGGHIALLNVTTPADQGRRLEATVRIPADKLDAALSQLRRLGRVESESQSGEEVTQRYVDIEARLSNLRSAEQRMTEILKQRTGKLSEVLEVEEQITNIRGQIETATAEQRTLSNQIALATVAIMATESFQAPLAIRGEQPILDRLRNAAVDGFRTLAAGIIAVVSFLLTAGPTLIVLSLVLFFPGRWAWKRLR